MTVIDAPACTCDRVEGAHDERCAYIRFVRSEAYEPDLQIPEFLRRERAPQGGVFD